MDTKTKVLNGVLLVALVMAFIGYYFSLYRGNENNVSSYTNLILIFFCANGVFFVKKKIENKILDVLAKLNCVLFVVWVITVVVRLIVQ